jgi:hypothetical protein
LCFIDKGLVALHHDGFQDGQWGDRGGHALDEVDAVFFSPTLQDLAVGGAGYLLNSEVAIGVVADRVNGHPITLFELGVVVPEGAQDHGVAGPGRQQIVDLRPHLVVATYAASGLQVKPICAWGRLRRLRGLVDNAAECLGHRHGPPSSIDPATWT